MLPRSEVITVEQLTRLKINKYRHIQPGTELHFNSGFNVLLGKNGTGKTTLLDLISIVISGDFSVLRGEEFDLEYELDFPELSMVVEVHNNRVPRTNDPLQLKFYSELVWFVQAQVNIKKENEQYRVMINQHESIVRAKNQITNFREPTDGSIFYESFFVSNQIFSLLVRGGVRPEPLWDANVSMLDGGLRLCRFDESLEIFELILGTASKKLRRQPPATISFSVWGEPLMISLPRGFYPNDASEAIRERLSADIATTTCELTEKHVGHLAEFARLIGASSIKATISLDQKVPEDHRYDFKIREFSIEYPDGRYLTHEKLSYGQKRLLAFLYYLDCNEKFVIADELTDSFHHSWIEFCMEKLATRQCFLSSQNPILLDYLPIGSEEDAKKTFIQCRLEPNGNKEQMVWRNLSDEEAESFYKDLSVGIQSVSEVLMFRGLW